MAIIATGGVSNSLFSINGIISSALLGVARVLPFMTAPCIRFYFI